MRGEFAQQVNADGKLGIVPPVALRADGIKLKTFHLSNAYPNPFNSTITIAYNLPETNPVIVSVYDLSGRTIKTLVNTIQPAGRYSLRWNSDGLPSGVYFYQIQAGAFRQVRKCLLVK